MPWTPPADVRGQASLESTEGEPAYVEGVVERIVFESGKSGFLVGRLRPQGKGPLITFVGVTAVSAGETVRLWGRMVDDQKFGRQLRVEKYETVLPSTVDAIEKYLGSGLIHGIGPAFAKRIVEAFGIETLRVIQDDPQRLSTVGGIGPKRAAQIRRAWEEQRAIQSIMLFLQGHGISTTQAIRIFRRYGDAAVAVLRDNPYRLADEVSGIAFKTADAIAAELGIAKDSPKRAAAGLLYTLERSAGEGHVYLPRDYLIREGARLLEVDEICAQGPLEAMAETGALALEGDAVFLPRLHVAETGVDHCLKRLIGIPIQPVPIRVEKAIEWIEKTQGIRLSVEQSQALRIAFNTKAMVITGGPGTGKTTVLKGLIAVLEKKGLGVLLAAPTGRAAKRMTQATGREAKTIHRLLEFSPKQGGFLRHEGNPLAGDLVVIDESSMVDVMLMHSLLRALPPAARLVLVGDVDQLPSVGPGNVLMDIIASNRIPVIALRVVFRQAAQSGIISNAHRINVGQSPEYNDADFFFVQRSDPGKARDAVCELVSERIPGKFGLDPFQHIQVLAPMHRGEAGVASLNIVLQQKLNPYGEPIANRTLRMGDKVMQLRNNYERDVFNGDVGVVSVVDSEMGEVQVQFDDRAALYTFEDLDELALAYACTVHKAQGSEYPAVVIPLLPQHFMMLQRNVFYTAITRASRLVVIVGNPKAVAMAVRNTNVTRRFTRLCDRLRNARPFEM